METMRPVFEYLDYRDILKEAFEEKKVSTPLYSYRMLAENFGLDTSNMFRVLQKDSHLPARCQSRALEFLGLTGRSGEYFLLLIAYARERNAKARAEILEKAMDLRDVERRRLTDQELAYYRDWWVVAIRSLVEVMDGRVRPAELAERLSPSISEEEASRALDLLLGLGLVKKASSGRLLLSEVHITAGGEEKTEAVRQFQRQILSLASEAIERFPREKRDISTITFAVDHDAFVEIREMLRESRRQIQKRIEESKNPDRVMQLAMALFPLAPQPEETA
ncbi:MAG: TIGR02147 family protein [Fibrobacterota bacterium]|nr:MAG: TIGR02147 family protein [Fibrobacterota bacterium]